MIKGLGRQILKLTALGSIVADHFSETVTEIVTVKGKIQLFLANQHLQYPGLILVANVQEGLIPVRILRAIQYGQVQRDNRCSRQDSVHNLVSFPRSHLSYKLPG